MRLTIFGGSAASPNTGMGCSGLLEQADRTTIVLDLGPGTLPELRRHADFRALDAVIISHMQVDHVLDLLALRHALASAARARTVVLTHMWKRWGLRPLASRQRLPFMAASNSQGPA